MSSASLLFGLGFLFTSSLVSSNYDPSMDLPNSKTKLASIDGPLVTNYLQRCSPYGVKVALEFSMLSEGVLFHPGSMVRITRGNFKSRIGLISLAMRQGQDIRFRVWSPHAIWLADQPEFEDLKNGFPVRAMDLESLEPILPKTMFESGVLPDLFTLDVGNNLECFTYDADEKAQVGNLLTLQFHLKDRQIYSRTLETANERTAVNDELVWVQTPHGLTSETSSDTSRSAKALSMRMVQPNHQRLAGYLVIEERRTEGRRYFVCPKN